MTNIKTQVPHHLKVKITSDKFLGYLKETNKFDIFVQTYHQARPRRKSMLEACKDAMDAVLGGLTFVWFGEEQLHRIHLDPHLILPELQKL